jgi:hypothetical protein
MCTPVRNWVPAACQYRLQTPLHLYYCGVKKAKWGNVILQSGWSRMPLVLPAGLQQLCPQLAFI